MEPDGLDYVFNGMGEETFEWGISLLRRGGIFVHYGGPQSFSRFLLLVGKLLLLNLLPNGKTLRGYGTHTVDMGPLKRDWAALFQLLAEDKIHPQIACTLPILE